jgi:hypothetical protein
MSSNVLKISTEEKNMNSVISPCETIDSIVSQFVNRAKCGKKKYGVTLDREDLSLLEWVQHTQAERMDAILRVEKLMKEHMKQNK